MTVRLNEYPDGAVALFWGPHRIADFPPPAAAASKWTRGFAKSVLRQSRRRGWEPTPKQLAMMRRLVAELFENGRRSNSNVQPDRSCRVFLSWAAPAV